MKTIFADTSYWIALFDRKDQNNIEVIEIDTVLKEKSLQVFKDYDDKDFSFTDCSSFALMASLNIKNAVSFDKHFSQIGITTNSF